VIVIGERPQPHAGLRHLALFVERLEETVGFYVELLGFAVEWNPDPDNYYLCSGCDNLALHRFTGQARDPAQQRLDHLGLIVDSPEQVDAWHAFLAANGVRVMKAPKTHRDGARSFYCLDPDGNSLQIIHHPPVSGLRFGG
jgi:catechol 2,3-dioxygenase-like lactoylglutathione lyase family enzyme